MREGPPGCNPPVNNERKAAFCARVRICVTVAACPEEGGGRAGGGGRRGEGGEEELALFPVTVYHRETVRAAIYRRC